MAGFLKKALSFGGKLAAKSGFPGAAAVGEVMQAIGNSGKKKTDVKPKTGDLKAKSTVAPVRGGVPNGTTELYGKEDNMFKRVWKWLMDKKNDPKTSYIFWLIVAGAVIVVGVILWLLWTYVLSPIFRRKKSGGTSYRRTVRRSASAPAANVSSGVSKSGRRMSAAQKAALARGRAKLAAKRRRK